MKQVKYLGKNVLLFYLFSLTFLGLMGCEQTRTDIDLSNTENNTSKVDQEKQDLDIDSFYNLQEHIIQNDLNIEKEYDANDISLNVNGEYDLNKDGKMDLIEVRLVGRKDCSIRINKCEISIDCETPFDFYLVDLIKDDEFIEFAIYDDGPSGDPETIFYRYDGTKIYELGSFNTDINVGDSIYTYYGNALTDGKGNFIPPSSIARFVSPNIIKGYYSVEKDKFLYNSIDYSKYIVDEYSFTMDFEAYFIDQNFDRDFNIQDIEFLWDEEAVIKFKKGEKIKIIIIDEFWYGIQLQDGTTGILYFWIGD